MLIEIAKNGYKISKIIVNFFVYLFNVFVSAIGWIYEFLFDYICILDSDIRRDIFIGVTGLMVAIVIFVAEIVSNKKFELEKKLILQKTKIKEHVRFCIIIFFFMLFSSLFISFKQVSDCKLCIECDVLYFIIQCILNISIFWFMVNTVLLFYTAVKLNVDKKYFYEELDKYIYEKTIELETSVNNIRKKDLKKLTKKFNDYILNNKLLSDEYIHIGFEDKEYVPLFANKRGVLKSYNYKKIDLILDNIQTSSLDSNEERNMIEGPLFVFTKKIGTEIEKGDVIGYYLKGYKNYFNDFSLNIVYDDSNIYINDEINIITKEILDITEFYANDEGYDNNCKVFNYLDYLYKNNYNCVKDSLLTQIIENTRIMYKDYNLNQKYVRFLNNIASLAYIHDNFEDYKTISEWIYICYYQQTQINECDIKQVAYDFSNHYFKYDYYSIKKNKDTKYYDLLISKLLKMICNLIRDKKIEAIPIIFKNITLEFQGHSSEEFSEKNIINFQFAIGIIYCVHMYIEYNEVDDNIRESLLQIIKWTKQYFMGLYEGWSVIIGFKKYFNKSSHVQKVYDHIEMDFIDHKYLSSWSTYCVDPNIILKEFTSAFNIRYTFEKDMDFDDITKDDLYYFKSLLELFNSSTKTKFEISLKLTESNGIFDNIINNAICDAQKKQDEFVKSNKLSNEIIESFQENLKERVLETNELEKFLSGIKKVETTPIKLNNIYGINHLVSRDLFFDDGIGNEVLSEQIASVFQSNKEEKFIKKIDNISTLSKENLDTIILNLDNIEDYVLISNYLNCCHLKCYNHMEDNITINEKKLDVLKIAGCDNIYLIEKNYLPRLQYCSFADGFEKKNINEHLFYDFNDLSKDEALRTKIITESSWLSEKGNIYEQHEYLSKKCRIRVYLSYRFSKVKNSKALKFEVDIKE